MIGGKGRQPQDKKGSEGDKKIRTAPKNHFNANTKCGPLSVKGLPYADRIRIAMVQVHRFCQKNSKGVRGTAVSTSPCVLYTAHLLYRQGVSANANLTPTLPESIRDR